MYKGKYSVLIGRFQPFHNGHLFHVKQGLLQSEELVIVLGSSNGPRTIKNPFTALEREDMIRDCLTEEQNLVTHFVAVEDAVYSDNAWSLSVIDAVETVTKGARQTVLVGHDKDDVKTHDMFPMWRYIDVGVVLDRDCQEYHATDIRAGYFRTPYDLKWLSNCAPCPHNLPVPVFAFLSDFMGTDAYAMLEQEQAENDAYKAAWAVAPYPPTFVAVDACVVQQGHVLLIRRKHSPGKGLWALPGGFVGQDEWLVDAMIRELHEETRLKVPAPVLRGNIVITKVFDAPNRSLRGRMFTHASLIHLPPRVDGLAVVKGSDDAEEAKWWPLNQVKRDMMFDDHKDIIESLSAYL